MATDPMWVFENYAFAAAAIDELEDENAKLRAELERRAVDGWKLVPVEPTPEMVSAAEEAYMPFGDMDIALRMAILAAPSAPKADDPVKQMLLEALQAERETLRQQIAERDAEIERLRVKLMAIASAEPGRHNIEWAKAMAATGGNEAYAKWREAFDQRDKLAGLLREVRVIVAREVERWTRSAAILPVNANVESGLLTRIDAALDEVKLCQESPHPAAT